jgi:hypothetical protein
MVAEWLRNGCGMVAEWLRNGCGMVAEKHRKQEKPDNIKPVHTKVHRVVVPIRGVDFTVGSTHFFTFNHLSFLETTHIISIT